MSTFSRAVNDLQIFVSRSTLLTYFAVKLRNQCRMIINYHINPDGIDARTNGEGRLLEELAPHCSNFIDVGANVGDWTHLVLLHKPKCHILMFEPAESAAAVVQQRFLNAQNVELLRIAVGDEEGILEFFEEPDAGKTSSPISSFSTSRARRREIRLTTIDVEAEKRGWPRVDFLKIDTEGYDFHVICGASRLLSEQRIGVLQFEYNKPWADVGSTLGAALRILTKYGYSVFLLRANGLHPLRFHVYQEYFGYSNFVAVSPEMLPRVRGLVREEI